VQVAVKSKKAIACKVDGFEFKSNLEYQFYMWLKELKALGYISKIEYEVKSFAINDRELSVISKTKKLGNDTTLKLIEKRVYTPDFKVTWCKNAYTKGLIKRLSDVILHDDIIAVDEVSWIEVKPVFDQNNMERIAKTNIAVVYHRYKTYIQIVKPEILFSKTFYPKVVYEKMKRVRGCLINDYLNKL